MKLSQLSLADYNKLDNIPVINQDLTASGFTPVANTYYRHTGATTDTFTQGVIYLYDTAYHKLGEGGGGGGTTLNKYTTVLGESNDDIKHLIRILRNAKSIISFNGFRSARRLSLQLESQTSVDFIKICGTDANNSSALIYTETFDIQAGSRSDNLAFTISASGTTKDVGTFISQYTVEYCNYTEIT